MSVRLSRVLVAATLLAATALVVSRPADAATNTVVSFTFDDGTASHPATATMLQSRGMRGTYYINSGLVGSSSYYLNWSQIHGIAAGGHEIGGHTLTHADLTRLSLSAARSEVCQDRQNLVGQGFSPVSFAYPYAAYNATAKQVVQECGYVSGRGVGGVVSGNICEDCPYAETVPPADAFALSTPESADSGTSLALLQSYVTQAETHGGGWVVLSFHGVCSDNCTGGNSFSPTLFAQFLDWLQARQADGTVVRTVAEVMGAGTPPPPGPPVTNISCAGAACSSGWYRTSPVSVALSAVDPDGSAIASTRYTTDGSDPVSSATATTYSGPFAVAATTTVRYYSTDVDGNAEAAKTQLVRIDTAAPAVALTADATDQGSGIAQVVFRDGATTLATDMSAPYTFNWVTKKNLRTGSHSMTAVATDTAGNSTTSAPVTITITR
jgi:peptidoglycan/xylan/chitin deacetylase (PgdA/CDA1 family)